MTYTILVYQIILSCLISNFQEKKMDNLLVFGDGFSFSVKEPDTYVGDTQNAGKYEVNVIFYKKGQDFSDPNGIIRVRLNGKVDENTAEDLAYDMKGYKKQYSTIQFKDIKVSHPSYRCFAKLFVVKDELYEYVTYLNPGREFKYTFSVSMTKEKSEATEDEMAAYNFVIASLNLLNK